MNVYGLLALLVLAGPDVGSGKVLAGSSWSWAGQLQTRPGEGDRKTWRESDTEWYFFCFEVTRSV